MKLNARVFKLENTRGKLVARATVDFLFDENEKVSLSEFVVIKTDRNELKVLFPDKKIGPKFKEIFVATDKIKSEISKVILDEYNKK